MGQVGVGVRGGAMRLLGNMLEDVGSKVSWDEFEKQFWLMASMPLLEVYLYPSTQPLLVQCADRLLADSALQMPSHFLSLLSSCFSTTSYTNMPPNSASMACILCASGVW